VPTSERFAGVHAHSHGVSANHWQSRVHRCFKVTREQEKPHKGLVCPPLSRTGFVVNLMPKADEAVHTSRDIKGGGLTFFTQGRISTMGNSDITVLVCGAGGFIGVSA
jgi:hypothetical protein